MTTLCNKGCLGVASPSPLDLIQPILNNGEPLINILTRANTWSNIDNAYFDVNVVDTPSGTTTLQYKFKDTLGFNSPIRVRTNADCQLEWREKRICSHSTEVAEAAIVGAESVVLTDVSALAGINTDTRIHFLVDGVLTTSIVDTVNAVTNTITLKRPLTIALAAGDMVTRGAYNRGNDCVVSIDNSMTLRETQKYVSNFRKISISHKFDYCDLSLDRYVVGDPGQAYLDEQKMSGEELFMLDLMDALHFDTNTLSNAEGYSESMGLITEINRVQDECNITTIRDLENCCDIELSACQNAQNQIKAFFEIGQLATESGMYNDEISIQCNEEALKALTALQPDFQDFGNVQLYKTNDDDVNIGMPQLTYGGWRYKWLKNEVLTNKFPDTSVMIMFPKDSVGIYQRAGAFNRGFKAMDNVASSISSGIPMIAYDDRTEYQYGKLSNCSLIYGEFEYAVVYFGMDTGAYKIIKGLGTCLDTGCDVKDLAMRGTLIG